jgi:NAD(P)-dependent dehydrogenase (short-subunit alcohol dehydrogenase family)
MKDNNKQTQAIHQSSSLSRRHFIAGTGTAAVVSVLPGCIDTEGKDYGVPEGVPLSQFTRESTALDVTEGLDLTGKTALITGCNSGLGYETMRVLALRGATVIGAARTKEKADIACESIEGETVPVVCELSDLQSVADCGSLVRELDLPIDMLILNAGIMALPELEQVNGIEKHFFVNHLGHFVLANQVLPQVLKADNGRVVVLSSSGHSLGPESGIEFDNLSGERDYSPWKMYGQSKMANGLFSLELNKRLQGTGVTSNSVHPGVINTNLGRHFPWWQKLAAGVLGWSFMKTTEAGAGTQAYVATATALEGYGGYYFSDCNPVNPDPRMQDERMASKCWDISEEMTRDFLL